MLVSPKLRRNLARIAPFPVIWLIISLVFMVTDMAAMGYQEPHPDSHLTLTPIMIAFGLFSLTLIGVIVGAVEVLLVERRFRNVSFSWKILYKFLMYGGFLFSTIVITFPIATMMELETTFTDAEVWRRMGQFLGTAMFLSTAVQLGFSLLASLFYTTISEHIGHSTLINLFTGLYHTPKVEERIFMFLDMKDSTTIAENLGHLQYFELLRQYYDVMASPIINNRGEVYQHVGDEVVISWKLDRGLDQGHCLQAFFDIKAAMKSRQAVFLQQFGIVPDFKAGIHLGEVTTGEIGALKREIVFTGDVLNTTARLQSLCGKFDTDLIVSEDLVHALTLRADEHGLRDLGQVQLKGKSETLHIYAIKTVPA